MKKYTEGEIIKFSCYFNIQNTFHDINNKLKWDWLKRSWLETVSWTHSIDSLHQDTMRSRSSSSSTSRGGYLGLVTLFLLLATHVSSEEYYGKLIGKLSELHHGVSGEVYAVDGRTLFIKDFTYDGQGPAAYFYAGNSMTPITNGFKIRDERGMSVPLKRYRKKGITLTLPERKTLNNIKWFSVWCDDFSVNFGDVKIPRNFDYPKPQKLAGLNGVHGVSSEPIVIVDAQTLLIPSFSYDGEAPDAKFWVGPGAYPSPQGHRVPDENGKITPLRRYDRKTIVLTLPKDLTVFQLGHFGVWCEAFTVDFGHVKIPQSLNVPPSLKMLGVSPQSKLNCEVLEDNLAFEVRWAVAGDSIVFQLVSKLDAGQYMSFGLSANPQRSVMIGGDIVVAWVDKETLQGYAIDYFLDAKSQCSGGRGSCPDIRIQENTNSIRLLNAAMVNGYSIVTYQRPLIASDELDRQILTNGSQAIIWGIGPLNERNEVSFHTHYLKTDKFIEFGRAPSWNCPMPDTEPSPTQTIDNFDKISNSNSNSNSINNNNNNNNNKQDVAITTRRPPSRLPATPAPAATKDAWEIPPIQCYEPEDGVFYAQMGPTGGKHGYPAITGHVGWGISWYINGLLIPEINVIRGKTYTFVVEGGDDSEIPARYHPFYITDDSVGGYQHKTPEEKAKVKIFAGVQRQRGSVRAIGVGRLCNWIPDEDQPSADEFSSFGAYQRTLSLKCDHGEPGVVTWTPDENTPDTVYYQCFTHRFLGWKINVLDSCDVAAPSETHEIYASAPSSQQEPSDDLESAGSINVNTKVTPAPDFYQGQLEHGMLRPHHNHHQNYKNYHPNNVAISSQMLINNPQLTRTSMHPNDAYKRLAMSYIEPPLPNSPYYNGYNIIQNNNHNHHNIKDNQHHHHHHHQNTMLMRHHVGEHEISQQNLFNYYRNVPNSQGWQETSRDEQQGQQSKINPVFSTNLQSHLITDRQQLNYGNMKTMYPPPSSPSSSSSSSSSTFLSAPSASSASSSQPATVYIFPNRQTTAVAPLPQLPPQSSPVEMNKSPPMMIIRRPGKRPQIIQPEVMSSPPLRYTERKKVIYRPTKIQSTNKFIKNDKQKLSTKIESKISTDDISDNVKPAKNTGFDPDSIVIEGGFKPIIRAIDRDENMARSQDYFQSYWDNNNNNNNNDNNINNNNENNNSNNNNKNSNNNEDKNIKENNFEPIYSPQLHSEIKKSKKKVQSGGKIKHQRLDNIDDMDMAADGLDAYYLPPTGIKNDNNKINIGTLITYDGKKVKDSNLARSIPPTIQDNKSHDDIHSSISSHSRLTDLLSKTPQFGKFRGELPPPISTNINTENLAQLDPRATTKLNVRTKRSTNDHYKNSTKKNDDDNAHDFHEGSSTFASTGHILFTNLEYVALTIILYFVL